jgi:phage shock protein PspC (stress-responsive transcriptional regulator)
MYCRNCSHELDEKSVACIKCGYDPKSESNYCHNCGCETNEKQIICLKCGTGLEKKKIKSQFNSKSDLGGDYDRFYRSSDQKIILGVCGGISHKFGIQLGLVRFGFVIASFFFIGWIYFGGLFIPKLPTKDVPTN